MRNQLKPRLWGWKYASLALALQLTAVLALAQVQISGKITGPDGTGIPSISVQVRTTTIGAVSDANGAYTISAVLKPGNYILEFSGVGFKSKEQSIQIGSSVTYTSDIQLDVDALKLDEVVLIGSSLTQSRKQLGNTVNSVSSKQLANTGSGNLTASLQGKVPGCSDHTNFRRSIGWYFNSYERYQHNKRFFRTIICY
ncbi:MAG: carboxypeptidase-like regulatory domain-containing protein [Bacteroidota bacterium]